MPYFQYKAVDTAGKWVSGRMQADNLLELEQRLSKKNIDFISGKEIKPRLFNMFRRKLSRTDLINLFFQLEQLTAAGVPLLDALVDLRDSVQESYYWEVLSGIIEAIDGGKTFSEALLLYNNDFDTIIVSLIAVGEESGRLTNILSDLGETLRWIDELASHAKKIAIYPAIVAAVILSVTSFLMIYLVPQIIPFVNEMGGEVPDSTLALIAVSNFFSEYWWLILITPPGLWTFTHFATKNNRRLRLAMDKMKLKMPLFGPILFKMKIARFANYVALLYASGITVLRALAICKVLMDNQHLEDAVTQIQESIGDGSLISDSFSEAKLFPPFVVRMVKVGENTGNLDQSLLNVSYFYNREVKEAIDKIEPAINPVLTVIMGSLLAWIMTSVLGPIWDTIGKIG